MVFRYSKSPLGLRKVAVDVKVKERPPIGLKIICVNAQFPQTGVRTKTYTFIQGEITTRKLWECVGENTSLRPVLLLAGTPKMCVFHEVSMTENQPLREPAPSSTDE